MAITEIYCTHDAAGGGAGTLGDPYTLTEGLAAATAGTRLNVVGPGTYSETTTTHTPNAGGSDASGPFIMRGVDTSGNAMPLTQEFGGTGAFVATDWPVISFTTGIYSIDQNICHIHGGIVFECSKASSFTGCIDCAAPSVGGIIAGCVLRNLSTSTSSVGVIRINGGLNWLIVNNDIDMSAATGTSYVAAIASYVLTGTAHYIGNRFYGPASSSGTPGGSGIYDVTGVGNVSRNVIWGFTEGIHNQDASLLSAYTNNTFYDCDDCIASRTAIDSIQIANNLAWAADGSFYDKATAVEAVNFWRNAVGSMTSSDANVGDHAEQGRIALTVNPYLNAAAGDFRPNMKAGGGLELYKALKAGGGVIGALPHPYGIQSLLRAGTV